MMTHAKLAQHVVLKQHVAYEKLRLTESCAQSHVNIAVLFLNRVTRLSETKPTSYRLQLLTSLG